MEDIKTFNDLKKKYNIDSVIISENILNKVNIIKELIKTDTYVKKVEKSTSENSLYTSSFNCKFKNEDIKKKKITSFLNKLSIDNFDKIYNNIVNDMNELYFSDNINLSNQKLKLSRKFKELENKVNNLSNKLKNKSFLGKAPKTIVLSEKKSLIDCKVELKKLNSILNSINN